MAIERHVTADDMVFLGEDKLLSATIYQADGTTPQDVAGWAFEWVLRKKDNTADPALISKTTVSGITITGVYNVVPGTNTQRVVVTLLDTDSDAASGLTAKTYRYSLKRTDAGLETVLTFGNFVFRQATAR